MKPVAEDKMKPSVAFYDMKGNVPDCKIGDNISVLVKGKVVSMSQNMQDGKPKYSITVEYEDTPMFAHGKKSNKEMDDMDIDEYAKHRNKS